MTVKLQEEFEASKMVMEIADSMDNRTREGMMGGGGRSEEGAIETRCQIRAYQWAGDMTN